MKNSVIITVIIAIVVGVAAFYGGMQYQRSQRSSFVRQFGGGFGGGGMMGGDGVNRNNGLRPVAGQIMSNGDNTFTIKMNDGSSRIVVLTDKTAINKTTKGTKSDLKKDERVVVFGNENNDGTVTAQNIQIGGNFGRP